MQVGNLYRIKKNYWIFYSTINTAVEVDVPFVKTIGTALHVAKSNGVDFLAENDCFVLLEDQDFYRRVLSSNGELGWILVCGYKDPLSWDEACYEEVTQK